MIEVRETLKTDFMFLSATIMSVVVHCMIASLLLLCLKAKSMAPFIPTIITIDIRSLEPVREEKPRIIQPPRAKPHNKLHSVPPVRIRPVQAQIEKPLEFHERKPSPTPSIAGPTGKPLISPPIKVRIDSLQFGTNTANITYTDNSIPSSRSEMVDSYISQSYLVALKEIIERHKEYPLMARRGRMEGTVRISCKLTRTGEIREAIIANSSGYEILDKAALRAVKSAGQFPVVPNEVKGDPFCFVTPITFRLSAE